MSYAKMWKELMKDIWYEVAAMECELKELETKETIDWQKLHRMSGKQEGIRYVGEWMKEYEKFERWEKIGKK